MEVLMGPTFTIDASSPSPAPPSYGGGHPIGEDAGESEVLGFLAGDSSESSSSIGTPDDSEGENDDVSSKKEDEEDVQSKLRGLGSLDSLEDSLPIKRGLSNHFIGKSKSFTDLSQVSNVKELQKQENPFNKRKRVLIAAKWSRKSSFYSWSNPKSMPLLPVVEDGDDSEAEEEEEEEKTKKVSPASSSSSSSSCVEKKPQDQLPNKNKVPQSYAAHMRLRLGSFKCRSLSLADLQEHDDEKEEDDDAD